MRCQGAPTGQRKTNVRLKMIVRGQPWGSKKSRIHVASEEEMSKEEAGEEPDTGVASKHLPIKH